jgi:hypothetical protein
MNSLISMIRFKPFAGFYGVVSGFTVALKQLNPDEVIIPTIEIRKKVNSSIKNQKKNKIRIQIHSNKK